MHPDEPPTMRPPTRPTSVTVFAILHIVFGGLGLCGGLMTFAGQAMLEMVEKAQPNNPSLAIQKELENALPAYKTVEVTQASLNLLLGIVMIVGGAMMLKANATGHRLTLIYA